MKPLTSDDWMGEVTQTAWKEKMIKKTENRKTSWIGSYTPYCCPECGHYSDSKTPYCAYCGRKMG